MEPQGADRSASTSGSEEMESDADSDHEDNEQEKDLDNNEQEKDSDNEQEKDSDDDNQAEDDKEESEDEDSDSGPGENADNIEDNESQVYSGITFQSMSKSKMKNGEHEGETQSGDSECFPMADLPLEVITTVEPTNYAYPILKNMSNGVLTHRNIFTEHERSMLKEIINKYRNIVDTRSRTRTIYLEKQSVWQQIVEEYNSTENIMVRTEKELRKCWDNMKYRERQAEKRLIKVENNSFSGMENDLQTLLARQAIAIQMKALQGNTAMKADGVLADLRIKMEPSEQEEHPSGSGEDDDGEGPGGAEDEREPALKKARQESPKLSSLLLAAASKRTTSKKSTPKSSSGSFPYSIPACTKVLNVKNKNSSNLGMVEIPILPKNLANCLSITNIPNPSNTNSHGGSSLGAHERDSVSPSTSPIQHAMKPMPSLKKMVPGKHQSSGASKSSRSQKKANALRVRNLYTNNAPSMNANSNSVNNSGGMHGLNNFGSPTNSHYDVDRNDATERLLNTKLANQRLELERKEHELRLKLMEKELQAQTYQSQYWYLKLKLLQSGRDNSTFNLAGATNGDID